MNGKTFKYNKEVAMKLYVGIKKVNEYFYIAALDNEGVAVLKNQFPITASYETIINCLSCLQDAFQALLRIAICSDDDYVEPSFIEAIKREYGHIKLVKPALLYSTDLMPEDTLNYDIYRHPIHLAILRSLCD